jgi:hypothetical protein
MDFACSPISDMQHLVRNQFTSINLHGKFRRTKRSAKELVISLEMRSSLFALLLRSEGTIFLRNFNLHKISRNRKAIFKIYDIKLKINYKYASTVNALSGN